MVVCWVDVSESSDAGSPWLSQRKSH